MKLAGIGILAALIAAVLAPSPALANPGCDMQWNVCTMGVEQRYRDCLAHPIYGWFPGWFCEPEREDGQDACDSDYYQCMYCESRQYYDCNNPTYP